MDKFLVELHHAKRLANIVNAIEGIIKVLEINEPIKNILMDNLTEMKDILREAGLKKQ